VRLTTVSRFNWLAEPARTVEYRDRKPARTVGFCKLKIPHKKSGANRGGGTGGEGVGGGHGPGGGRGGGTGGEGEGGGQF
jgi:hypothetical protein